MIDYCMVVVHSFWQLERMSQRLRYTCNKHIEQLRENPQSKFSDCLLSSRNLLISNRSTFFIVFILVLVFVLFFVFYFSRMCDWLRIRLIEKNIAAPVHFIHTLVERLPQMKLKIKNGESLIDLKCIFHLLLFLHSTYVFSLALALAFSLLLLFYLFCTFSIHFFAFSLSH